MAQKPAYLFLHGGPGLNSNPEKHLLLPRFQSAGLDLYLWNEPSARRDPAPVVYDFANWLLSAENYLLQVAKGKAKVRLLAHSYGTQAAIHLARKFPNLIEDIIFMAPAFAMHEVAIKIFTFCQRDFMDSDPGKAGKMEEVIRAAGETFDDAKARGWLLALTNPRFATHYFYNQSLIPEYFGFLADEHQIDIESLMGVEGSAYRFPANVSDIPAQMIFGAEDELIDMDLQTRAGRTYFRNVKTHVLERAGHFLYLDALDEFMEVISKPLEPRMDTDSH